MRTLFKPVILIFLLVLGYSSIALAKEEPDILLKRVTHDLISELRRNDSDLQANPNRIYSIINRILVPYVDWTAMAQWVVGRNAWLQASPSQRERFVAEFRDLLIRTYASTLRAYKNQTIEYFPVRGGIEGKSRVQITSYIREPGRESIKVDYRLVDKTNSWKVYDIIIEGVSLLKGFQAQFANEIKQKGLDSLIERLHQHNEKPLR